VRAGFRGEASGERLQGRGFRGEASGERLQGRGFGLQATGFRLRASRRQAWGVGITSRL
jgi:hypothetical protein